MTKKELEKVINGIEEQIKSGEIPEDVGAARIAEVKESSKKEEKDKKKNKLPSAGTIGVASAKLYPQEDWMPENESFNINMHAHDIPYKEQLWHMPPRAICYNLERAKLLGEANNMMKNFFGNGTDEYLKIIDQLKHGRAAVYKFTTYECIPHKLWRPIIILLREGKSGEGWVDVASINECSVNSDAMVRVIGDYIKEKTGITIKWQNMNKKTK